MKYTFQICPLQLVPEVVKSHLLSTHDNRLLLDPANIASKDVSLSLDAAAIASIVCWK